MLLILVIRLALAAVFIAAATAKLIGRDSFAATLTAITPVSGAAASVALVAVPAGELAVGCELVVGGWMPWTAAAAAGMLVVFSAVLVAALAAKRKSSCGCFGGASRGKPISWRLVARNGCLFAGCLVVALAGPRTNPSTGAATALMMALAVVLLLRLVKGRQAANARVSTR